METLTFEVVRFHGAYHAILGCPCYRKFMAIPNYTYLRLKMPGPNGIIMIGTSVQCAYKCNVECCELTSAIIAFKGLSAPHQVVDEEAPDTKKSSRSFGPAEDTKEVPIDPSSSNGKVVRISTTLSPK
jgi:hypothetical protein